MTIEEILKEPLETWGEGKQVRLVRNGVIISIVGGRPGLYGDFVNTFEVAVMDSNGNFITKHYFPDHHDDVIGYISREELPNIVDKVLGI